jgi:Hsp70 protein
MIFHQATPPLGLSVGATNLAGASDGHPAVMRPSVVTVNGQRLAGFVDRVGDPVPLVAPDGSNHRPEHLLAEALHDVALSATAGGPAAEMAVAVPAHWPPRVVDALRRAVHREVVSDATAALTALRADPGLPAQGVIVLCDFGGSGTSITLADATSGHALIGETLRFADFSGDLVDQALLRHVAASFADSGVDPAGTAMVGSLSRLRAECRGAKERLSSETATSIAVDVPGYHTDFRVTRAELDGMMHGPLTDFLAALDDTLQRYHVAPAAVSAVATIGGGARIPLVTQLLSEHLRVPVVTSPQPQLTAALGAALVAQCSLVAGSAPALTPAADVATTVFDTGAPSSTFSALAWSQDDGSDADVLFASADTDHYQPPSLRPEMLFQHEQWQEPAPARRAPLVLFGLAAAAAVLTTAVFGFMQLSNETATPVEAATTVAPSSAPAAPVNTPAPPAPQAPPATTVVVQPAQRSNPAPRQQAPAPKPPAAPVTAAPPAAPPPTTPPISTPPTTPPSTPPSTPPAEPPPSPPSSPEPPPIDPGPGNGETPGEPPAEPPSDPPPGDPETPNEIPAEVPPVLPEAEGGA